MTTLEAIKSLSITDLTTKPTKGTLITGECNADEVRVLFSYDPKSDKFIAISVFKEWRFSHLGENWRYNIGCAIKATIKKATS